MWEMATGINRLDASISRGPHPLLHELEELSIGLGSQRWRTIHTLTRKGYQHGCYGNGQCNDHDVPLSEQHGSHASRCLR